MISIIRSYWSGKKLKEIFIRLSIDKNYNGLRFLGLVCFSYTTGSCTDKWVDDIRYGSLDGYMNYFIKTVKELKFCRCKVETRGSPLPTREEMIDSFVDSISAPVTIGVDLTLRDYKYITMNIEIRRAKCTDIPKIIEINQASLPVVYDKEEWIKLIIYHITFIAVRNDTPLSYITTWEETYRQPPYKKDHIVTFATLPEYRSQGIGGKLLQHLIDHSHLPITLNVICSNKRAIKFYKRYGFTQYKSLKNYYGTNMHGLQMIK